MTQTAVASPPFDRPEPPVEPKRKYPWYVIRPFEGDRVRRFLEIFAAILGHSNYKPALDQYARSSMKCSSCTTTCPVYATTKDPRDIPCYRSGLHPEDLPAPLHPGRLDLREAEG